MIYRMEEGGKNRSLQKKRLTLKEAVVLKRRKNLDPETKAKRRMQEELVQQNLVAKKRQLQHLKLRKSEEE